MNTFFRLFIIRNLPTLIGLIAVAAICTTSSEAQVYTCPDSELCYNDCCASLGGCTSPGRISYCGGFCNPPAITEAACTASLYCKYNTYSSEYNFLEVTNRTAQTIYGYIQLADESGTMLTPIYLKVLPYQRRDFDLHSLVGRNHFGQAFVKVGTTTRDAQVSAAVAHYYLDNGALRQTVVERCDSEMITP